MTALSRRVALRTGLFGGAAASLACAPSPAAALTATVAAPAAAAAAPATASAAAAATTTVFDVTAFGAVGDGATDDTAAIQAALDAAGEVPGSTVSFPPAAGGCYRVGGLTVTSRIGRLTGQSSLFAADGPGVVALRGSVLAPIDAGTAGLLTIGVSGNGTAVTGNPHGLCVEGLGFLGTTPAGDAIPGFWGATVTDTSDVTFLECRDLFCGAFAYAGYPDGGDGTGGFAAFLSSGTGNAFSVNGRVLFCNSYGAGTFLLADGLSATYPGGGSTDGRVVCCQVNGHGYGVVLGLSHAGAGGWAILETHLSSEPGVSHIEYGAVGNAWTLRVEGCYLDVCGDVHINCGSRGLLAIGNYFRGRANATAVRFSSALGVAGRDPAAQLIGNTYDLDGNTAAADFARFNGFTAAAFAESGGGEYRGNLVHNHGAAMPADWIGQFAGSDAAAVANSATATLDLAQGPVLSA